jgi:hypothetical protein
MEYVIPLSYNLHIKDVKEINYKSIEFYHLNINSFKLFYNEDGIIYKINSHIKLKYLLNILGLYKNKVIVKIYKYLILKYLLTFSIKFEENKENKCCFFYICNNNVNKIIFKRIGIIYLREYVIIKNGLLIETCSIDYNYCLIVNNKNLNKTCICIIDDNCILNCLFSILRDIYSIDNIKITIIGGSVNNVYILINIFNILKKMKLSKFIYKTYILIDEPLKSIQYDSKIDKFFKLPIKHQIKHKKILNYLSFLNKINI